MKIKFLTSETEYNVLRVEHESDRYDVPVDIVIYGDEDTLNYIGEYHCPYGYNVRKIGPFEALDKHLSEDTCVGLFSRLTRFIIKESNSIIYK